MSHGGELCFFGERGGEAIQVGFDGMPALRFDEDLMTVLVGEAVDLVFNAGAVARPFACDGTAEERAISQAVLENGVDTRVGVGDVSGVLVAQVR